jgi:hypothetical protein
MTVERDEKGLDAPAPLGHPGRAGLPTGHPTGPEVGGLLPDFELRDAYAKFEAHGIKLYAVSYDDQSTLQEYAEKQAIPFPLLSDIDSEVIRQYQILNTEVSRDDAFLWGIPFPGAYVADETGTDNECLLPKTETFNIELAMDVIDVPALGLHLGHGQRERNYNSMPAMRRLIFRKVRQNPLGLFKFLFKNLKLELAARRRRRQAQKY